MAIYYTYARCKVGKGAKIEHGRPDQNTDVRKLSERKESGGTVQNDKNGRIGYEKPSPIEKNERRSTARVARQVWVQRAAHSKRVARKKSTPKILQVKSGGQARAHAGRTKKTHPNTYNM